MLNNYIKELLTIDLQNGLTKQSSSYTIWFQMRWGMTSCLIKVITKLPNSEQSYKGKVKTHNYINRQNQSTTGKLWKP
jgi:hypothetical protein